MNLTCDLVGSISVSGAVEKRCPFRKEADVGRVTVTWKKTESTLELHKLRKWLDSFKSTAISHEDFTRLIATELSAKVGKPVAVHTEWTTADLTVVVTA